MAERGAGIEAVISDFGGVLTTPLIQSFMAFQDETGITPETLGKAMAAITEANGEQPAVRAGAGRDHARPPSSTARRRASSRCSGTGPRCTASKRSTSRRCDPNPPMIELMRELKGGRLPDGDADQQRARVGAALALDAARRRDLRDRRRLGLRRLPQAGIADLRADPGADRDVGRGPASSSTTSRSTAKGRGRCGHRGRSTSATTSRRSRRSAPPLDRRGPRRPSCRSRRGPRRRDRPPRPRAPSGAVGRAGRGRARARPPR